MAASLADVRVRVADTLGKSPDDLEERWAAHAAAAFADAQAAVFGALLARGYTAGQVGQFDRLPELILDQATWYALTRGAALAGYDVKAWDGLDRRKELAGMPVTTGGGQVLLTPAGVAGAGGAGLAGGSFDGSKDRFSLSDAF